MHQDIEDVVPENEVKHISGRSYMICRRFTELYSAYLDDALGGEEKAALEEHVRSCFSCRRMASEVRCVRDEVSSLTRLPDQSLNAAILSAQIVSAISSEARTQIQSQNRRDEFFDRMRVRIFSQSVGTLVSILLLLSVTTSVLGPAYRATLDVASVAMNQAVARYIGFGQLESEIAVPDELRIKILLHEPPPPPPVFNPSGAVLGIGETLSEEGVIFATVQVRNDGRASITQVVDSQDAAALEKVTDSAAVDKLTDALIQHANFQPSRRRQNSTSQAVLMFSKINIQG